MLAHESQRPEFVDELAVDGRLEVKVEVRDGLAEWYLRILHSRPMSPRDGRLDLQSHQSLQDLTGRQLLVEASVKFLAEVVGDRPETEEFQMVDEAAVPSRAHGLRTCAARTHLATS